MDLNEIPIFIQVVKSGSIIAASRILALPNSTVSFKLSSLEKRLGVTLIQRTTRKLNVTAQGLSFYKRCIQGVEEIYAAEQEILSIQKEPQGLFRMTAPRELSHSVLPDLIHNYSRKFDKTKVELIFSDQVVDLLSENIDLAIRAGHLKDSTLIAKKIGSVHFVLVATAQYLKAHIEIKHPRELWKHHCLQFTPLGYQEWRLTHEKTGTINAPVNGQIIINDLTAIKMMALNSAGVALLPFHLCYKELQSKKLIQVLPEWRSKGLPVHFVYPAHKFVTPKLSQFIQMSLQPLKNVFEGI